jgi:hypothetical protein
MKQACGWLLLVAALAACDEATTNLVIGASSAQKDASPQQPLDAATAGDAAPGATTDAASPPPVRCGTGPCACDDGIDNDGDGLRDGLDPECTGPFDDNEQTFATGLPLGGARCRDCFWDDNAGSGDDQCRYPAECLEGKSPAGNGSCSSCEVAPACVEHCKARTPNGCDCFGCCEVRRADGSSLQIALSDSCSLAKLDDVAECPRCVQNTACMNPCGRCELCAGRTPADLPADCGTTAPDAGVIYSCDDGETPCSATSPCVELDYCQQGCCLPTVF